MDTPSFAALVPMLPVTNVPRTIAFYEQLGFSTGNTHAPEELTEPVWAWLYCEDVTATHALLKSRGLDVGEISYPFYNPRGEFHVHDPDGYAIFVAHAD